MGTAIKDIWYEIKHTLLAILILPFLLFLGIYEIVRGESLFDRYNDNY